MTEQRSIEPEADPGCAGRKAKPSKDEAKDAVVAATSWAGVKEDGP